MSFTSDNGYQSFLVFLMFSSPISDIINNKKNSNWISTEIALQKRLNN